MGSYTNITETWKVDDHMGSYDQDSNHIPKTDEMKMYVILLIISILYLHNETINKNLPKRIKITCMKYV